MIEIRYTRNGKGYAFAIKMQSGYMKSDGYPTLDLCENEARGIVNESRGKESLKEIYEPETLKQ